MSDYLSGFFVSFELKYNLDIIPGKDVRLNTHSWSGSRKRSEIRTIRSLAKKREKYLIGLSPV